VERASLYKQPNQEQVMNKQQTKQPAKPVYRELVTIDGKNVVLPHNEPPVINAGVLEYFRNLPDV
jgi:hypothetical protein